MPGQPAAFMSYVRFNDQHDDGRLSQFRERLSAEVRVQTGEEFPIFQDRNDIAWGQNWQERIDQTLDAVTLLLVIITPGFFRSPACRAEVKRFLARERDLGRDDLILPVYYVTTPELEDPARRDTDELARVLASRQYADWRELRFKPYTSPVVRRAIAHLAARMRDTFWRPSAYKVHDRDGAGGGGAPVPSAETADRVIPAKGPPVRTEQPSQVTTPEQREGDEGSRIGSVIEEPEAVVSDPQRPRDPYPFPETVKGILLMRSLCGYPAKLIGIIYDISLAWAVAWTATGIAETVRHFSVEYLIIAILIIFIGSVLIPWGLYKSATKLDRRRRRALRDAQS